MPISKSNRCTCCACAGRRAANDNSSVSFRDSLLANSVLVRAMDLHGGPFSRLMLTAGFWREAYGPHVDADFRVLRRWNLVRLANDAMASLFPLPEPLRAPVSTAFPHLLVETPSLWMERDAVLRESEEAAMAVAMAMDRPDDTGLLDELADGHLDMLIGQGRGVGRLVTLHALALPLPNDRPALIVLSAQNILDALIPADKPLRRRLRA